MGKEKKARLLTMDELQNRPCEVNGTPALFHRWMEDDSVLLKLGAFVSLEDRRALTRAFYEDSIIPAGGTVTVVHHTFALVEFEDGTIGKVKPEDICFVKTEVQNEKSF